MVVNEDVLSLVGTLEELVVFVRRLPAGPEVGLTAVTALRAVAVEGPQRISELAERLGVSQPGATQVVDRLARSGWAERVASPDDGRVVLVRATKAGQELLDQRRAHRSRILDDLIARLGEDDRRRVLDALPALHRLTQQSP